MSVSQSPSVYNNRPPCTLRSFLLSFTQHMHNVFMAAAQDMMYVYSTACKSSLCYCMYIRAWITTATCRLFFDMQGHRQQHLLTSNFYSCQRISECAPCSCCSASCWDDLCCLSGTMSSRSKQIAHTDTAQIMRATNCCRTTQHML